MKQALIVIAHGSRKKETQQELKKLTEKIRSMDSSYEFIDYAFLELSEPKLPDVIAQLHQSKIEHINVFPYFLNSGRHVDEDLPDLITQAKNQYPELKIELLKHFGSSLEIPKWILNMC